MTTDAALADALLLQQPDSGIFANIPGAWTVCGRAKTRFTEYSATISEGFFMNSTRYRNAEICFRCRSPHTAPEVQIWAGFRARDRHYRYVVGLRGGNNDHVYLARYGSGGASRFLGIAPLDFSPKVGVWYTLRIVLWEKHIRIFLGDSAAPCIEAEDDDEGWTEGGLVLGGGYLPSEFSDLKIRELISESIPVGIDNPSLPALQPLPSRVSKKQAFRHALYQPIFVSELTATRTEISLDGHWLFLPMRDDAEGFPGAADPAHDDSRWHTIDVPNLWTPTLSWLHGETTFNEFEGISSSKGVNDKVWLKEMSRLESYGFDWKSTTTAWYRHHLILPEEIGGRRFELCFDAIAKACEVWFNGVVVGTHIGMFGEIRCDVSTLAKAGLNTLAVKVLRNPARLTPKDDRIVGLAESVEVTQSMISSLPTDIICHDPAGIWQPVRLIVTRNIFVRDVFVQPTLNGARLDIEIGALATELRNRISVGYVVRSQETGDVLTASEKEVEGEAGILASVRLDLPNVKPALWHPESPHLYEVEIQISQDGHLLDRHTTTFGFRTFTISGNQFLLNGKPYWLRGAGHFPHGLRPNDRELARHFVHLAREGNVRATRFHVAPLTKVWADETDRQGMLVSFEGIWPWLMLKGDLPDPVLLDIWHDDFAALIRKYRNHPSVVLWTVNNEMKFYLFDRENKELLRHKWAIVTRMIKTMRALDPTRPVIADSGYVRKQYMEDYENIVLKEGFDDGDVDDVHQYYGWYHPSFTTAFGGEFAKTLSSPDRPFISQELSSGYPRNDDGAPVRFYLFKHGTPQALVGDYAFEHQNPTYFLKRLAFIAKNTGEAIRRTNRAEVAGIMHFAYLTWFQNVHDEKTIRPWTAPYHAIKSTLQPVLISAEFFSPHFFHGDTAALKLHIINDAADGIDLVPGTLEWSVIGETGTILSCGAIPTPEVPYYSNRTLATQIELPSSESLPGRCEARLQFRLVSGGKIMSDNSYEIVLGSRSWARPMNDGFVEEIWLHDPDNAYQETFSELPVVPLADFSELSRRHIPIAVVTGSKTELRENLSFLLNYVKSGGRLLLLNTGDLLCELLPEVVKSWRPVDGQIVNLKFPESPIFSGIDPLDLAWLNCGPGVSPVACNGVFQVDTHNPAVTVLAEFCDFHNYLAKPNDIVSLSGTPLFEYQLGRGRILCCEINSLAMRHDPVARRLVFNSLCMYSVGKSGWLLGM